jgi:transcriptional regulator with XRE-family HTH domain
MNRSGYIQWIPDLGTKIDLLLTIERNDIGSSNALARRLDIGVDYLSRLKNGSRRLTEEKFSELCKVFGLSKLEWYQELEAFGEKLGFSRKQIAAVAGKPLPGIDFLSRLRGKGMINDIFDSIAGYWESYYFSVSRTDKILVSRDILIVSKINDDEYIECEIWDGSFTYKGWCFPIKSHLYFILEKDPLFTEIIVYATNLPDRKPARLYGVILCLSGGIEETASYPSAAKVAFRYIGEEDDVRKKYNIDVSENLEMYLKKNVAKYVDPYIEEDDDLKKLYKDIENNIPDIPIALRMTK